MADLQRPLEKEEHQLKGDAGSVTSGEGAGLVTCPHPTITWLNSPQSPQALTLLFPSSFLIFSVKWMCWL